MQYICAISGAVIQTNDFSNLVLKTTKQFTHPIFSLSIEDLIKNKSKYSTTDLPLVLLSVLTKYPGLFTINYTNYKAIQQTTISILPKLIHRLSIINRYAYIAALPKFTIDTYTINNIANYLQALEDSLAEYHQTEALKAIKLREERREKARAKLLDKHSKSYPVKLSNWLIDQLQIPLINIEGKRKNYKYLADYYKDLFKALVKDSSNVFDYPKKDFDTFFAICLEKLINDNDNAIMVYQVLNAAEREFNSLTIDLDFIGTIEPTTNNTNTVVNSSYIGKPKPIPKDYKDRTAYLIAVARWKVANNEN